MGRAIGSYFEFSPTDKALALLDRRSRMTFHFVVELDGRVPSDQLATAWSATSARHPILTSVVDIDRAFARWIPYRTQPAFVVLDEPTHGRRSSALVRETVERSLSLADGPVARLTQVRCHDGDALVFSFHHAALDGPATVGLLDDIRTDGLAIAAGHNVAQTPDWTARNMGLAAKNAGLTLVDRRAILDGAVRRWRESDPSCHHDLTLPARPVAAHQTLDLRATEAVATLRSLGPWSTTEILLCATSRAWDLTTGHANPSASSNDERPSGWLVTSDLRRRLSIVGGMGNLSGTEPVVLHRSGLAGRVALDECRRHLGQLRSGYPGLAADIAARAIGPVPLPLATIGLDLAVSTGTQRHRLTRSFSNFGVLPENFAEWPSAQADAVWIANPGGDPPLTNLSWTTFHGRLTLSARGLTESFAASVEASLTDLVRDVGRSG